MHDKISIEINDRIKDIHRCFLQCFDSKTGIEVLEYLDRYAHTNFPNYDNVNATYAKAGQQELVEHIKAVLIKAKKGGEK